MTTAMRTNSNFRSEIHLGKQASHDSHQVRQYCCGVYDDLCARFILKGDDAQGFLKAVQGLVDVKVRNGSKTLFRIRGVDMTKFCPHKPLLLLAARYGRTEIVKILVKDLSCNVKFACSKNKNTPLHMAAFFGHLDTVKTLVKLGARINVANHAGSTPACSAKEGIKEWMHGANNTKNDPDHDPFEVCFVRCGQEPDHKGVLDFLLSLPGADSDEDYSNAEPDSESDQDLEDESLIAPTQTANETPPPASSASWDNFRITSNAWED